MIAPSLGELGEGAANGAMGVSGSMLALAAFSRSHATKAAATRKTSKEDGCVRNISVNKTTKA